MSSFLMPGVLSRLPKNGPDPLLQADGRLNGTRIQKRKKPGGRQATGRISHAWKEILMAHSLNARFKCSSHRRALPSIAVVAI
jgi:hypothetical protein